MIRKIQNSREKLLLLLRRWRTKAGKIRAGRQILNNIPQHAAQEDTPQQGCDLVVVSSVANKRTANPLAGSHPRSELKSHNTEYERKVEMRSSRKTVETSSPHTSFITPKMTMARFVYGASPLGNQPPTNALGIPLKKTQASEAANRSSYQAHVSADLIFPGQSPTSSRSRLQLSGYGLGHLLSPSGAKGPSKTPQSVSEALLADNTLSLFSPTDVRVFPNRLTPVTWA